MTDGEPNQDGCENPLYGTNTNPSANDLCESTVKYRADEIKNA